MKFLDRIMERARLDMKTIVLPEGEDLRVLTAAAEAVKKGIARIVLVGDGAKISAIALENNINLENIRIENPEGSVHFDDYTRSFYQMRKKRGMTLEKAKEMMKDTTYWAVMMVKKGEADGMVAGAVNSTADTLRPALQILKTAPGAKLVSAFFVMIVPDCQYGERGAFVFADSGLVENPGADELAEIAIASAASFEQLVEAEAKVAMLSYSTHGSALSELTQKVIDATEMVRKKAPHLNIDGELQADTALVPSVACSKAPGSSVAGCANVLVFPDLNSGNISYKLTQRLAKAEAYGPITQSLAAPVNDLSRGCSAHDIVGVIAITSVQAQTKRQEG